MPIVVFSGKTEGAFHRSSEAEVKLAELARQQESAITAELKRRSDLDAASAQVRASPLSECSRSVRPC